jgi:nitrogen fixation protein NifB
MSALPDPSRHPCFNRGASHEFGRAHLPVAPKCNLGCNYCNRKYDCVNESRPGVASAVLKPHQAVPYLERIQDAAPELGMSGLAVAGVAGPGDPLANPVETLTTLRLVRERFPEMLICLSTNGMALPDHLATVAELASHVTITINAVDPEVGAKIYAWVRDGKVIHRGRAAAELLLGRQLAGLKALKERGVIVKVNTIVIPGVNDGHVVEVARTVAALGADIQNLMPVCRVAGTPLGEGPEATPELMAGLRASAAAFLPQMTHCQRCRADAVGLLAQDRSGELAGCLRSCSTLPAGPVRAEDRPYVAVATREGLLVNLHLGQADAFQIWERRGEGFAVKEVRPAPPAGGGVSRWEEMARVLGDCRNVLVSGIGETPRQVLSAAGVEPLEMEGFIELALAALYRGQDLSAFKVRSGGGCCRAQAGGGGGGGGGMGCL